MSEQDTVEMWWQTAEETVTAPRRRVVRKAPKAAVARLKPGAQGKHDARGQGDKRKRPLSRTANAALALLTDTPQRGAAIRAQTGHTYNQLTSALYSLQQHGLAKRTPKGWVRLP